MFGKFGPDNMQRSLPSAPSQEVGATPQADQGHWETGKLVNIIVNFTHKLITHNQLFQICPFVCF